MLVNDRSRLKPGVSYAYEHVDGVTYAREQGAPTSERFEIGRTFDRITHDIKLANSVLWADIIDESEKNPALKDALEKCKIIYYLSKNDGSKT
jgi:hypothetical protein